MRTLFIVVLLSLAIALVSFPLMIAEKNDITKLQLVSWSGRTQEVVLTLNMPSKGTMTSVFLVAFGIMAVCSVLAIAHDARKYGFRWQEKK